MARLIDADDLFEEFERAAWYDNADRDEIAESILWQMPTVDAVEVVHGRWLPVIDEYPQFLKMPMLTGYKCSVCGRYEAQEEPYCHCGAKMYGERKENG